METPQKKSRFVGLKFTRRSAAIVVALLMVAAPASASIIVQNFMEAEITAAPPCFIKVAGADAASTLAGFDDTTNTTPVDGVDLLEEKIDLTGMEGDRVVYTDMVEYQNNCAEPIDVVLTTNTVSGDWADVAAEIWISNVAAPANIDPNLDAAGAATDWNDTYILVPAGTAAGAFVDSTGVVTVPAGQTVQGAFVVSTDNGGIAGANPVVNWVAQATIG